MGHPVTASESRKKERTFQGSGGGEKGFNCGKRNPVIEERGKKE